MSHGEHNIGMRRRMRGALLRKEWRESWWILIEMLLLPAAFGLVNSLVPETKGDTLGSPIWEVALLGIFAVLAGVRAFSPDRVRGAERFLRERPVRMATIWNVKIGLPFAALLASCLLYGIVLLVLGLGGWREAHDTSFPEMQLHGCMWAIVAFSLAVFVSVLADRIVTAWVGALAVTCLLILVESMIIEHLGPLEVNDLRLVVFFVALALIAAVLIPASRWIYVRGVGLSGGAES